MIARRTIHMFRKTFFSIYCMHTDLIWNSCIHFLFMLHILGMDVCTMIEKVKTDESDRPLDEIRIRSVDLE